MAEGRLDRLIELCGQLTGLQDMYGSRGDGPTEAELSSELCLIEEIYRLENEHKDTARRALAGESHG